MMYFLLLVAFGCIAGSAYFLMQPDQSSKDPKASSRAGSDPESQESPEREKLPTLDEIVAMAQGKEYTPPKAAVPKKIVVHDAGLLKRASSILIDISIVMLLLYYSNTIVLKFYQDQLTKSPHMYTDSVMEHINALILVLLAYAYKLLRDVYGGQGMGKRLIGLKVVNQEGRAPSVTQNICRNLSFIFEPVLMIDSVFALFGEPRQRLSDRVFKTRIQDLNPKRDKIINIVVLVVIFIFFSRVCVMNANRYQQVTDTRNEFKQRVKDWGNRSRPSLPGSDTDPTRGATYIN